MPAITLCANGHNICNICKLKVTQCPTCRQQCLNNRNVAIEKLATEVKYPCVYWNYGCMETYSFDLIGKLQQKCQYIPQPCAVNKMNLGSWCGISSQMNSHLKQTHHHVCMEYHGRGHHSFIIIGVTPGKKYWKVIFIYSDIFCCCRYLKWYIFSVLHYVVSSTDAAKISTSWNSLIRKARIFFR